MDKPRLPLASLMLAVSLPLHAQKPASPPALAASAVPSQKPAKTAKSKTPEPSCVCDRAHFKPLTDKARAVEEYWDARRDMKTAAVISGTGALFSLLLGHSQGVREASDSYERAKIKMLAAKAKAVELDALKVTGDDRDGKIEIKLKKGVDYTL